jgi:ABC-type polar amino acid transport system ATPase subunit
VIEVQHINKSFGATEVLKDVSVNFADGEVVAVIGPSGGGKSTLIRCINGLETLSAGDIRVDGKSVRDHSALTKIRTSSAMVFQQFNLYPHMTALANIVRRQRL